MSSPITLSAVAQKGGVGKSTTAFSIGNVAAENGYKVALIDFDPQGSLSTNLINMDDIPKNKDAYSFVKSNDEFTPLEINPNLYLIPASLELLKLDQENFESYFTLSERIKSQLSGFDLVVIDTAGTLKTSLIAALVASNYMYSPIELNSYSIKAYSAITDLYTNVQRRFNSELNFIGFLPNRIHGLRIIDGQNVPNQIDERNVYNELTRPDGAKGKIIYLLEELAGIRRSTQKDKLLTTKDFEVANKHLEAVSFEIFNRIKLVRK